MHKSELQLLLKEKFSANDIIDLTTNQSISIIGVQELELFFLGTNETLASVQQKGIASLRPGFYKIIEQPYYKINQTFPTFASTVLYFRNDDDRLIKYNANIGPLTNTKAQYIGQLLGVIAEKDQLIADFIEDRKTDTPADFYFNSKGRFYIKTYRSEKIFWVKESGYSSTEQNYKEITWTFIT